MFKSLSIAALLFTLSLFAHAQAKFLASPDESKKYAEGIVASMAAGNNSGATKELRLISASTSEEFDLYEAQLATQAGNFLRQIGSPYGYEYIGQKVYGNNLIQQEFIVLHEKAALRVKFVFYKGKKGWFVTHFFFDVNAISFFN